ncbi:MAG: hypothetical protein DU429_02095 [Candidatus Tokpelaia sp.]|nr:MAG: hypothetical protein DU430_03815 [Candidatus Tokpelaia sp.]KAA6207293.1 MAG: hypothetical protein DU429_02095 [Candidatus Tokpelaia sp.]
MAFRFTAARLPCLPALALTVPINEAGYNALLCQPADGDAGAKRLNEAGYSIPLCCPGYSLLL